MYKLLTVKQTADLLNCHPQSIYKNNELPRMEIPGIGIRFKESDIDKYTEQRVIKQPLSSTQLTDIQSFRLTIPPENDIIISKKSGGINELAKAKYKTRYNFGYGAIYQRMTKKGKVRWYLDYCDRNGIRTQKVARLATSKEEAFIALQEKTRKEFNNEHGIKRKEQKIKFFEFAEMYLKNYAKVNKRSWKDDEYRIEANMNPFFGNYELQNITPLLIEKYRVKRLETGVAKSTVNREITIMKKMFNLAIDWNLTNVNNVLKVKLFSEKDTQKERILTEEEEFKLLAESPDYLKPILITALNTGMRKGEILNLKWNQVDFNKRTVRVEHTKGGRNRIIPINDPLYQLLMKAKDLNGKNTYIFPNPKTGLPFTDVKKSFKNSCKRAGIDDLRFHDLRHTCATRLIESGTDIITIRDILGHFSVRVTQRYTHSNQNQKKEAVERLAKKSLKNGKELEELLHIRYTGERNNFIKPVNNSLSVN